MDNARLNAELASVRRRFGSIDGLTADEIAALVDACRLADNPFGEDDAEMADFPAAVVRGVEFRPLTIGASVWLDEYAGKWWGDNDSRYFWALVYALVHGRDKSAFLSVLDEPSARRAIRLMALRFTFSRRALERAVDAALGRVVPRDSKPDASHKSVPWNEMVLALETHSGIPREDWLWGCGAKYAARAYTEMRNALSARSGQGGVRMLDALDGALQSLAVVKKRIKDRLSKSPSATPSPNEVSA